LLRICEIAKTRAAGAMIEAPMAGDPSGQRVVRRPGQRAAPGRVAARPGAHLHRPGAGDTIDVLLSQKTVRGTRRVTFSMRSSKLVSQSELNCRSKPPGELGWRAPACSVRPAPGRPGDGKSATRARNLGGPPPKWTGASAKPHGPRDQHARGAGRALRPPTTLPKSSSAEASARRATGLTDDRDHRQSSCGGTVRVDLRKTVIDAQVETRTPERSRRAVTPRKSPAERGWPAGNPTRASVRRPPVDPPDPDTEGRLQS